MDRERIARTENDGHHRIKAWEELKSDGVKVSDYPRVIRSFDSDDDREEHAAKLNSNRRDISTDDKKHNAIRWRQKGWQYQRIASALGVTHPTVMSWCAECKNLHSAQTETIVNERGQQRPASYNTKPKPAVWATSAKDEERALTSLESLFSEDGRSTVPGMS